MSRAQAPVAHWLLPCTKQERDNDDFSYHVANREKAMTSFQCLSCARAPEACWMLPCSKQGEDIVIFQCRSFARAPVACWMLPCSKQGKRNDRCHFRYLSVRKFIHVTYGAFCTFLVSLTFFISCIMRPVHMVVFELHAFQLKLSGNRKYGKQLLPGDGKFILFDAPNHEIGTTSSTI